MHAELCCEQSRTDIPDIHHVSGALGHGLSIAQIRIRMRGRVQKILQKWYDFSHFQQFGGGSQNQDIDRKPLFFEYIKDLKRHIASA